jgi:hypothetical protein
MVAEVFTAGEASMAADFTAVASAVDFAVLE